MFRIWYSTQTLAKWLKDNTVLKSLNPSCIRMAESDASNTSRFHSMPDHIKKILYLDAPDIIVEYDENPILAVEVSGEAGTGHNAFQRFARIAAAIENDVPAFYIYPEATYITRREGERWDPINPNIFAALEKMMQIHQVPALLFYYPTEFSTRGPSPPINTDTKGKRNDRRYIGCPESADSEMQAFFDIVNRIVNRTRKNVARPNLINERCISAKRAWAQSEFRRKGGTRKKWSPETATIEVPTKIFLRFLTQLGGGDVATLSFLKRRESTVIYNVNARFRGDPYPGALAALDYLRCRVGPTYEDRDKNLTLAWGKIVYNSDSRALSFEEHISSISDCIDKIRSVRNKPKCLLSRSYNQLRAREIPRYYMQVRYGCTFTKVKEIRCYAYFADTILFHDGALWREG